MTSYDDAIEPAQSAVHVPRMAMPECAGHGPVDYPLAVFPWEPWSLFLSRERVEADAAAYADWLNSVEASRLDVIKAVLSEAGAPAIGSSGPRGFLAELGSWVQRWFAAVAEPLVQQHFISDVSSYRLGRASAARAPHIPGFSQFGDVLLYSLAHDLAFVVLDQARAVRPDLRWQPAFSDYHQLFFVTPDRDSEDFDLVSQVTDLLVQSLAVPRGTRGAALRRWYASTLMLAYQQMVTGIPASTVGAEFPDFMGLRLEPRYKIRRPERSDPHASPELTDAVTAMRRAGWFTSSGLSTNDLARATSKTWLAYEHQDIQQSPDEMYWRLLTMDARRTWSEDVGARVHPGDSIHSQTASAVGEILGPGLGGVTDAEEDWSSSSGDVLLTFRWRRRMRQLCIPSPGGYLSPALVTGLNALFPGDGSRLWFVDCGPPLGIVTRATAEERGTLEQLTRLRLDADPPAWWTGLAPAAK
jgi:hypothetical protein